MLVESHVQEIYRTHANNNYCEVLVCQSLADMHMDELLSAAKRAPDMYSPVTWVVLIVGAGDVGIRQTTIRHQCRTHAPDVISVRSSVMTNK